MLLNKRLFIVLVLLLSFFTVSFQSVIFQDEANKPLAVQSATTPTPEAKVSDDGSSKDIPTQEGVKFDNLLINETFDDNSNKWLLEKEDSYYWKGTRRMEGGSLIWEGVSANSMLYTSDYPGGKDLREQVANVQVSTRVKLIDPGLDGYIGLMIRSNETEDWHDYYFFGVATTGKTFTFLRSSNKDYEYLIWEEEIPTAVDLKDWNDLAVQAVGSHFRLFLNGELIGEVDDGSLAEGINGVMVSWNEQNTPIKVQFDNFVVREAKNVPEKLLAQSPSDTAKEDTDSEPAAPQKEKATKGPHDWSLPLYPDAEFLVSELDKDAATDANVQKQTRNLAIEPPYSYEFYYLPTVRSYDEVREFYKKEILKLGYSPAADLQGQNGIYLLTFVKKSSTPQKKIVLQYWSSSANIMIIYKNP